MVNYKYITSRPLTSLNAIHGLDITVYCPTCNLPGYSFPFNPYGANGTEPKSLEVIKQMLQHQANWKWSNIHPGSNYYSVECKACSRYVCKERCAHVRRYIDLHGEVCEATYCQECMTSLKYKEARPFGFVKWA